MKLEDLVLIDTCMWVPFFNRPQSRTKQVLDGLLDEDLGVIIGPVLAEVLLGSAGRHTPTGLHLRCAGSAIWRSLGKTGGKLQRLAGC